MASTDGPQPLLVALCCLFCYVLLMFNCLVNKLLLLLLLHLRKRIQVVDGLFFRMRVITLMMIRITTMMYWWWLYSPGVAGSVVTRKVTVDRPFAYSTSTWHDGGCTKNISKFVAVQRHQSLPVNVAHRIISDNNIDRHEYLLTSAEDSPHLTFVIPGHSVTSIVSVSVVFTTSSQRWFVQYW